jgi:hypothetical protein
MPDLTRAAIMDVAYAQEIDRYAGGAASLPRDAARRLPEALKAWERSCTTQARWRARLAPQSVLAVFARWRSRLAAPAWLPSWIRRIPRMLLRRTPESQQA